MVSTSDFPPGSAGVHDVPGLRYAFPTGPVATASVDIGHVGVRFELFMHGELEITTDPRADRECVLEALRVMAKRLMVSGIGSDAPTIASAGLAFEQYGFRLRAPHTMEFSGACTIDVARQYDCGTVGLAGAVAYRLDLSATPGVHAGQVPEPTQATAWFQRYEQELASIGVVVLAAVPTVQGRLGPG
jgi:hypothetical protein